MNKHRTGCFLIQRNACLKDFKLVGSEKLDYPRLTIAFDDFADDPGFVFLRANEL